MAGRRSLSLAAVLLVLVAVVALATRADTPAGGGGARSVDGTLVVQYLALVVLAIGAVVVPASIVFLWRNRRRGLGAGPLPARGNWMARLLLAMTFFALVAAAYAIYRARHHPGETAHPKLVHAPTAPAGLTGAKRQPSHRTQFDWVPAIVVFSTVFGGTVAAVLLLRRRGTGGPTEAELAEQLSLALDDSLDDLRAEADPRRAVIAAYARMERVLAAAGLPRRVAEAPLEYMTRVLRDLLRASAASVKRLTDLFEWAKFSRHDVSPGMKEEAIAALVAVRDELRAAT